MSERDSDGKQRTGKASDKVQESNFEKEKQLDMDRVGSDPSAVKIFMPKIEEKSAKGVANSDSGKSTAGSSARTTPPLDSASGAGKQESAAQKPAASQKNTADSARANARKRTGESPAFIAKAILQRHEAEKAAEKEVHKAVHMPTEKVLDKTYERVKENEEQKKSK
jgi:hypothetical protein